MNAAANLHRFSPWRTITLAQNAFTELVRMKVFYFLLIFSILIIASSLFVLRFAFEQELKVIKDVSLGAMSLFSTLLAIASLAMLLPKDLEDRTLYTVLSKPVSRIEYLLGKYLGVMALIAITLLTMFGLMAAVLLLRENMIWAETLARLQGAGVEEIALARESLDQAAFTTSLWSALWAIFLKSAVIGAGTLLLATFATSTLFTMIIAFLVVVIGHGQSIARDYWLHQLDGGWIADALSAFLALLFPDMQIFNIVDGVVAGDSIPLVVLLEMTALALFYTAIYGAAAWFVFSDKEV